jgi:hypothetical protein
MPIAEEELRALDGEQRLLDEVVELARRCQDRPAREVLDAVLAGTLDARHALPLQREDGSP